MKLRGWFSAAFALTLGSGAAAAQTYPARPVTVLVPFAAGGGSDLLARLVTQKLEERLGKPFIIENRPGAGTMIAAMAAVRAAPDGYTLMQATSSTMAINVTMYKNLQYEPLKDLTPVALLSKSPFFLVVRADSPVKSLADLIALARAKPDSLNYGSGGLGSMHHLSTELLLSLTGTRMTHVPYKATPPAMNDLLAGTIQVIFGDTTSLLPMMQQGTVRALAVSTLERSEAAPEVPTVAEAGVPGFEGGGFLGLVAPAGTPRAAVDAINAAANKAMQALEIRSRVIDLAAVPVGGTPEQFGEFLRTDVAKWAKVIQAGNVKAD